MQKYSIKYHVAFMWLYIFAVYLPFIIVMLTRHEAKTTSISVIGWYSGGLQYLIVYILLSFPFCIYQIFFFSRYFIGNKKIINLIAVISCILITTGAFIPVNQTKPNLLLAHTIISVSSSILLILTIFSALILHAIKQKHKIIILFLYSIYAAALSTAFYILYTAALFQLMATMSFFLILLFINSSVLCKKI